MTHTHPTQQSRVEPTDIDIYGIVDYFGNVLVPGTVHEIQQRWTAGDVRKHRGLRLDDEPMSVPIVRLADIRCVRADCGGDATDATTPRPRKKKRKHRTEN